MNMNVYLKRIKIVREKYFLEVLFLVITDLLMLVVSFLLSLLIRSALIPIVGGVIISDLSTQLFVLLVVINLLMLAFKGNYPGRGLVAVTELKNLIESIITAFFLVGLVIFVTTPVSNFSRSIFLLSLIFSCVLVPIGRFTLRKFMTLKNWWGEPIAIIGSGAEIISLYHDVKKCRRLGFRTVVGLYLEDDQKIHDARATIPFFPLSKDILQYLQRRNVKTLIVSVPPNEFRKSNPELLLEIEKLFIRVIFLLDNVSFGFLWGRSVDIEGRPAFQMQHNLLNPITYFFKKVLDFSLAVIFIIPAAFIIALISLLIIIDSPGPIFYTQERIGQYKKNFKIYKFRTMVKNADEMLDQLLKNDKKFRKEYEKFHKLGNDPRITRVGKILRRLSLDEIPQIFNVFKGNMSLIGPRAYMASEMKDISSDADIIFRVKPGLTGWWQVMGRNETTFEQRKKMDIYYINNWSLWMDLYIFLKSFYTMISGKGL
jgi:Undecaprenyl-phosphate galactose phosphotransferase WbaP